MMGTNNSAGDWYQGYTCPQCGQWVGSNVVHSCPGRLVPNTNWQGTVIVKGTETEELQLLKEIRDLLKEQNTLLSRLVNRLDAGWE